VLDVFPGLQGVVDGEKTGQVADVLLDFFGMPLDINIVLR